MSAQQRFEAAAWRNASCDAVILAMRNQWRSHRRETLSANDLENLSFFPE